MSCRSFRVLGVVPLLILAGCGGSTSAKTQTVTGEGFQFRGARRLDRSCGKGAVGRGRGRRRRPRRGASFHAREAVPSGALRRRRAGARRRRRPTRPPALGEGRRQQTTSEVAGRKARSYTIDYGPGKTQEIAFVLDGRNEYQLLCRRGASALERHLRAALLDLRPRLARPDRSPRDVSCTRFGNATVAWPRPNRATRRPKTLQIAMAVSPCPVPGLVTLESRKRDG